MLACSLWAVTSRRMTGITTGRVAAQARGSGKERRAAKPAGWRAAGIGADGGWRSAGGAAGRAAVELRLPHGVPLASGAAAHRSPGLITHVAWARGTVTGLSAATGSAGGHSGD